MPGFDKQGNQGSAAARTTAALFVIVVALTVLHVLHGIYFGSRLPNGPRSFMEGMHAYFWTISGDTFRHLPDFYPLYIAMAYAVASVAGLHWTALYLTVNSFFLLLLALFSALVGAQARDRVTGLLTAMLVMLYPLTSAAFNRFSPDFPLMAAVAMSLYLLYKSDTLHDRRHTFFLALTVTAGLLIKESFAAFAAGPLLYAGWKALADCRRGSVRRLVNLAAAAALCGTAVWLFYGAGGLSRTFLNKLAEEAPGDCWYSMAATRYLWRGLWEGLLSPPFFLLLLPGLYFFFKEGRRDITVPAALCIGGANIMVWLMSHWKSERYLLPELPLLALMTAFWLGRYADRKWCRTLVIFIAVFGVVQTGVLTYAYQKRISWDGSIGLYWWTKDMDIGFAQQRADALRAAAIGERLAAEIRRSPPYAGINRFVAVYPYTRHGCTLEALLTRGYLQLNRNLLIEEKTKSDVCAGIGEKPGFSDVDFIIDVVYKDEYAPWVRTMPAWAEQDNSGRAPGLSAAAFFRECGLFDPLGCIYEDDQCSVYLSVRPSASAADAASADMKG